MLNNNDIALIKESVNDKWFDVDKLIDYLNRHEIVDNEVFKLVVIDSGSMPARLLDDLSDKYGYIPVPVKTFIRRIPFYFYYPDGEEKYSRSSWLGAVIRHDRSMKKCNDDEIAEELETKYRALEEIYYHFHISVEDIFSYMDLRGHKLQTEQFMEWYDYLKLCEKLHWYDFLPDGFCYKYNMALEAAGRKPIIYDLDEMLPAEYCYRNGTTIDIQGNFPVDPAGKPILRWIGIILKKPGEIVCKYRENQTAWEMSIQLTPQTELYARNLYNREEEGERWYRLYAGPLTMEFDYTVLKESRLRLKQTQKEVAEAVGSTLRTYQKWETGETTPDSKYLLRLLNWLDIPDPVKATKWNEDWDTV